MTTHKTTTVPARRLAMEIRAQVLDAWIQANKLPGDLTRLLRAAVDGARGHELCTKLGVETGELESMVTRFRRITERDLYDVSTAILLESVRKTPKTPVPPSSTSAVRRSVKAGVTESPPPMRGGKDPRSE